MNKAARRLGLAATAALSLAFTADALQAPPSLDWPVHNGGPEGQHYSPLDQIDRGNVAGLQEAWRFETGVGGLQTSPLIVGRTLYGFTPQLKVLALDAATGVQRWTFDPGLAGTQPSRGFAYWREGDQARLFAAVMHRLYALDPQTGKPAEGFGSGGYVDLREGLGRAPQTLSVNMTSPGVIFRDMIIVGFRTSEAQPAAPGAIRAYDVRTGALRWKFDLLPAPGEVGASTWPAVHDQPPGGGNAWAGLALDPARGIVYAPTGSAVNDFYGADRVGDNLFANSLVAIDAATGKRVWHFQAVHHDIWDRDFPSPPVLLTVRQGGRAIDAVAQPSKQGMLYVFDRATGRPLFPIEERATPRTDVPGEVAAPTQPFAVTPAPFARQQLTEDLLTRRTPAVRAWALEQFRSFRNEGPYTPLRVGQQTVVFPGFDGGAEWGGPAVDPRAGVIYINANDLAWTGGLTETAGGEGLGTQTYQNQCAACHGADRQGMPPVFPALAARAAALSDAEIADVVRNGKARMPGFPIIANNAATLAALTAYVRTGAEPVERNDRPEAAPAVAASGPQPRYRFTGYRRFLDPEGYPAVAPPWGTLNAIDLNTGRYLWKIPLGEYPELAAKGMKDTGSENYGGPIVTAGGVVLIGATNFDSRFRAFDSRTGRLLWSAALPYAGNATPATYMVDGRQYVVIAASNARNPVGPKGSAYVAFALPARR